MDFCEEAARNHASPARSADRVGQIHGAKEMARRAQSELPSIIWRKNAPQGRAALFPLQPPP